MVSLGEVHTAAEDGTSSSKVGSEQPQDKQQSVRDSQATTCVDAPIGKGDTLDEKTEDAAEEAELQTSPTNQVQNDAAAPEPQGEGPTDLEDGRTTANSQAPLHSVFSRRKRHFIIWMAAVAGFFSPFSANIYFPALNAIAIDLKESQSIINLTLTSYMIFQGLAPTFFGDLADAAGRRPTYIIGFVIYIGACVGIALQHNFAALFVLRCLQSTGSSGTVALASGVAADVATSAERGKYIGWVTSGAMVGPALGPVLGGLLSQYLGWRWIFWFLAILAGAYMVPLVVAFPETGRNVVGDGSIPPQGWNMSLLNVLEARRARKLKAASAPSLERTRSQQSARSTLATRRKHRVRIPNPLNTLKIVLEKDVCILLLYNALIYTAFYAVTASLPYLFQQIYGFDELRIGLSFLPFGAGCFLAPLLGGRALDWNFRRVTRRGGFPLDRKRAHSLKDFPLEHARVPVALPLILVGDAALLCYGWVLQVEAPLAAPLVILFVMGVTLTGSFNVMSVILVDYYPMSPSTATAGNNLVRCWMGAAGSAVIIYMIEGMGRGWCFTFIAAVVLLSSGSLLALMRWGPGWREERRVRMEANKAEAEARKAEKEGAATGVGDDGADRAIKR